MIFQNFNLLMQRNCLKNVCFPLELAGVKRAEAREKGMKLLRLVGLQDKALAYPAQLSGGQQQRVAIARALATTPKVLLCNEATSALDPATTLSILDLIQDINQRLGITVVIITHQMSVVQRICRHVAILEHGQVAEQGTVSDVFTNPRSQAAKHWSFHFQRRCSPMFEKLFDPETLTETWGIVQSQFPLALWETVYVTVLATAFAFLLGLPLGVLLVTGEAGGIRPLPG